MLGALKLMLCITPPSVSRSVSVNENAFAKFALQRLHRFERTARQFDHIRRVGNRSHFRSRHTLCPIATDDEANPPPLENADTAEEIAPECHADHSRNPDIEPIWPSPSKISPIRQSSPWTMSEPKLSGISLTCIHRITVNIESHTPRHKMNNY